MAIEKEHIVRKNAKYKMYKVTQVKNRQHFALAVIHITHLVMEIKNIVHRKLIFCRAFIESCFREYVEGWSKNSPIQVCMQPCNDVISTRPTMIQF